MSETQHTSEYYNLSPNDELINSVAELDVKDFEFVSTQQASTNEADGIEILVNMAKHGKVDPWNIDIVDITDKYLAQLFKMKAQNLRLTGRTLLFAAVLLKLKSNILEGIDVCDFDAPPEEDFDYTDDYDEFGQSEQEYINTNNVVSLEEVLERRTSVKLNRSRVVTLKDLIRQLQFYEEMERKRSLKNAHERAKRRVRSYARLSADDIINLAHDEYIENGVMKLKENLARIFEHEEKIELKTLTLLGMDKISAYISLLFLTAESDYDLVQDEFYGDLYVVKSTIPSKAGLEEAQEDVARGISA